MLHKPLLEEDVSKKIGLMSTLGLRVHRTHLRTRALLRVFQFPTLTGINFFLCWERVCAFRRVINKRLVMMSKDVSSLRESRLQRLLSTLQYLRAYFRRLSSVLQSRFTLLLLPIPCLAIQFEYGVRIRWGRKWKVESLAEKSRGLGCRTRAPHAITSKICRWFPSWMGVVRGI